MVACANMEIRCGCRTAVARRQDGRNSGAVIEDDEQATLATMKALRASGSTYQEISDRLNRDGVPTRILDSGTPVYVNRVLKPMTGAAHGMSLTRAATIVYRKQ